MLSISCSNKKRVLFTKELLKLTVLTSCFIPHSLFLVHSLPVHTLLAAGTKWAGREEGMARRLALKPQPLFEWGCLLVHYIAFPSSCRLKKGMYKTRSCLL